MFEIAHGDFSVEEIIDGMGHPEVGAIIAYVGTVRSFSGGREVAGIEFDHDETAIDKVRELTDKALEGFDIKDVAMVHRVGKLEVGDKLLLIAVSAAHRQSAFAACMSIIDGVKDIHATWAEEHYKG